MESTIAIVSLGGKQHLVSQGTRFVVNQLTNKVDETLDLPDLLSDRVVQVRVISHQLGKKVNGLKFKAKTRYLKRYGHRQPESIIEVVSIGGAVVKAPIKTAQPKTAKKVAVKVKKVTDGAA